MKTTAFRLLIFACLCLLANLHHDSRAAEFHVATAGNDQNRGTRSAPLRSIQHAAELAQPGDVITVYKGVYRERVNPPRGGTSDSQRIVYRAARGERVEIRGSELVKNWVHVQGDIWKAVVPNTVFGKFNPYTNLIAGDWFEPKGRSHHTGAVYLNRDWLIEAAKLEEVMNPRSEPPSWWQGAAEQYLLNVAWLRPVRENAAQTAANAFAAHHGVQTAPSSEGGQCIGWIEDGDWVRYEGVDFGKGTKELEIRAASATAGGVIEIHQDFPEGDLLGTCRVPNTGGWQSWSSFKAALKPVSGSKVICLLFKQDRTNSGKNGWGNTGLWFAELNNLGTTIWAQFKGVNPNEEEVEINARQSVFYPDHPGVNYITVRGFTMRHAATPWAPPTAEQVGLIGTHWSKGWIIENNIISHSICSGVSLGKHGDQFDNTSANTAEGYVKTIERAYLRGWNRDTIGHHVVRNNTISHCEQAGVVGSLGAAFSTVSGNTIHDIHVRRLFTGAEMAGIKFHAAIDSVICNNHIHHTCLGLWLDWMAQGTRVSANIFHDNDRDLFVEVDHGPFVVDNNLFLSHGSLLDVSEGGAYAHNLFFGNIVSAPEPNRETPYHPAHTTSMAGLVNVRGGDNRFFNNLFVGRGPAPNNEPSGFGLAMYDKREFALFTGGNIFYNGSQLYSKESGYVRSAIDPSLRLATEGTVLRLVFDAGDDLKQAQTQLVTTELLGRAKVPNLPYENADGSRLRIDRDFLGNKRAEARPTPGPFEQLRPGANKIRLELAGRGSS
jgi:hypothetical protein